MNLVLVGFMGTGKSRIGRVLAQKLNYEFIDTDLELETRNRKKISQIFEEKGEAYFRALENKLAGELGRVDRKVIATGGGWVLNQENLKLSRKNGFIISLTARADVIYQRVKHETHRPLLAGPDPAGKIDQILKERDGLYHNADLLVNTSDNTPEELAESIIDELKRRGIVDARS